MSESREKRERKPPREDSKGREGRSHKEAREPRDGAAAVQPRPPPPRAPEGGGEQPREHRERSRGEGGERKERREREAPREGEQRREAKPGREERERERPHGEGKSERSERRPPAPEGQRKSEEAPREKKKQAPAGAEDQEAWLDSLIADCDPGAARPPPPREGGGDKERKMPKRPSSRADRPSSRADSRPKGDFDANAAPAARPQAPEAAAAPRPEAAAAAVKPRPPEHGKREAGATRASPAVGATRTAHQKEVPLSEAPDDEIEFAPDEKPATNGRSAKSGAVPVSPAHHDIDEEITVAAPEAAKKKSHNTTNDDIAEEIEEYEDEFCEDDDDEEGEEEMYKPKAAAVPAISEPPQSAAGRPVVRPTSSQANRGPSPRDAPARSPSPGRDAMAGANDIKEAMAREKAKLKAEQSTRQPLSADGNKKAQKVVPGLGDFRSDVATFKVAASGGTANEKAALKRLRDLKKLKIFDKRSVENVNLFQQRQQKDISLFLAGKSLKYCNLKTGMCQTGEDDLEIGTQTEEIWHDDKEVQVPDLTERKAHGELLPFLRRVLPLFETSMAEEARRREARAPAAVGQSGITDQARVQASYGLSHSFLSKCIGIQPTIADISICPQWYGADHAIVLYTWPEVPRPAAPPVSSALEKFTRGMRSLVGLYPIVSADSVNADRGENLTRPARCLYSFCSLTSLVVVSAREHLIVAGSEMGSLLVWDLRSKTHQPGEDAQEVCNSADVETDGQAPEVDPDIAYFEGKTGDSPWLASVYSTDVFAIAGSGQKGPANDDDQFGGGLDFSDNQVGVHSVEICCVRCSDPTGGDSLIFALDISGVVSFWRVLELGSVTHQGIKLALQGSMSLAQGAHCLGDFLSATYMCIHPQQQAQFVVCSTAGLQQANRKRTASLADGPKDLQLLGHLDEEELTLSPFNVQPSCAVFSPFCPSLLLVAYAEGDLALFDCTLCVPVTHWAGVLDRNGTTSVAWSTRRPCVFFVKTRSELQVWDLSRKFYAADLSVDVGGGQQPIQDDGTDRVACADLFVDGSGRPVVGHGGAAMVIGLPEVYTRPVRDLQELPPQQQCGVFEEKLVDDLLVGFSSASGFKDAAERGVDKATTDECMQVFPTLVRNHRTVEVPDSCAAERELLRRILASAQPLQAWV